MKRIVLAAVILSVGFLGCEEKINHVAGRILEETMIHREVAIPSGDWTGSIDCTYGPGGNLRHVSYEFRTFTGYDRGTDEFSSTRCVREYDVAGTGEHRHHYVARGAHPGEIWLNLAWARPATFYIKFTEEGSC